MKLLQSNDFMDIKRLQNQEIIYGIMKLLNSMEVRKFALNWVYICTLALFISIVIIFIAQFTLFVLECFCKSPKSSECKEKSKSNVPILV